MIVLGRAAFLSVMIGLAALHMAASVVIRNSALRIRSSSCITRYMSTSENIIKSETNSKIKLLKSLNIKKKREENNMILLEGHRQVIDAINLGIHHV